MGNNDVKVVPSATIKLESIEKNGLTGKTKATANVALKKKINDIAFTVKLSDATLRDMEGLTDLSVTAEKKIASGVNAQLSYDVPKKAMKTTLTWTGEDVTLKGTWKESSNSFEGEATLLIDSQNKVTSTYDFSKSAAVVTYTHSRDQSSVAASYDFAKDKTVLKATTKRGKDTYQAVYGVQAKDLELEWSRKPYKMTATATMGSNGLENVSAGLMVETVHEL